MIKYRLKQIRHRQPWLINGAWVETGWLIVNPKGGINLTPGAGWFTTIEHAWLGIEALETVGDEPEYFHRYFRELVKQCYLESSAS